MHKVGEKFIVEIGEVLVPNCDLPCIVGDGEMMYRIKGFKSLVFDEQGLKRLEKPLFGGEVDYKKALDEISMDSYKEGYDAGFEAGAMSVTATGEDYERGLKEGYESGWEFAKKVSVLPNEVKKEIFGTGKANTINLGYTYQEAKEAVDAYERTHFCVGDVVEYNDGSRGIVLKVTQVDRNCMLYHVLWSDGSTGDYYSDDEIIPTNRRFDLSDLFRSMEADNADY